jgi:membrane-bound lytic murein transglycosylase B
MFRFCAAALLVLLATPTGANVERSLMPVSRPSGPQAAVPIAALPNGAPQASLRPLARPRGLSTRAVTTPAPAQDAAYTRWLADFRREALRQGIRGAVFDRTMSPIRPNMAVLQRESNQPEFSRPIWEYLDSAVSDSRIRNGQAMLQQHRALLDQIEARYGVEREVVVAIWGLESAYGALRGRDPILPSLAALAMHSRRAGFYQQQLIGALQIIQAGDTDPAHLTGSWAGAMGHTQFIPTSYLSYAVDFTGDGRRDIWSDDPADSLASTAAYLSRHGWARGQPWGLEVRVPEGFNPRLANSSQSMQVWRSAGVVPVAGGALPSSGEATLLFPAGSHGPAILALSNFRVIKRYNNADAYAIAVGHLADRLRGAGPIRAAWPRDDRPLGRREREELQTLLRQAGFYDGAIDGRIGQGTLSAVRDWQASRGLAPDGYVSFAMLQRMRR